MNNTLEKFFDEHNIKHSIGVPFEHAQLGKVERANRTLYEGAEAMQIFAGFPPSYWVYCIEAFCYIRNLIPVDTASAQGSEVGGGEISP